MLLHEAHGHFGVFGPGVDHFGKEVLGVVAPGGDFALEAQGGEALRRRCGDTLAVEV